MKRVDEPGGNPIVVLQSRTNDKSEKEEVREAVREIRRRTEFRAIASRSWANALMALHLALMSDKS